MVKIIEDNENNGLDKSGYQSSFKKEIEQDWSWKNEFTSNDPDWLIIDDDTSDNNVGFNIDINKL